MRRYVKIKKDSEIAALFLKFFSTIEKICFYDGGSSKWILTGLIQWSKPRCII